MKLERTMMWRFPCLYDQKNALQNAVQMSTGAEKSKMFILKSSDGTTEKRH